MLLCRNCFSHLNNFCGENVVSLFCCGYLKIFSKKKKEYIFTNAANEESRKCLTYRRFVFVRQKCVEEHTISDILLKLTAGLSHVCTFSIENDCV